MRIRLSELVVGSCFISGPKRKMKKKMEDGRIAYVDGRGKIRSQKAKGDPEVESRGCSLKLVGILRQDPSELVELGDGRPLRERRHRNV